MFEWSSQEVMEFLEVVPEATEDNLTYTYQRTEGDLALVLHIHTYDGDVEIKLIRGDVEILNANFLDCSRLRLVKEHAGEVLEFFVSEPNPSRASAEPVARKVCHLGIAPLRVFVSGAPRSYP